MKRTINPGNQGIAVLVFDMPTGAHPSDLVFVFHTTSDSPGVAINVDWKS
ncbi:hypothetical protein [Mycobacterium sp. TY815]|nr:hypothetical protein [Mycobacterium sp. TY815]MDP7707117.1 hypothetical protein [Mycobacterium sp. TY815]